jgi:hypothetical protein
LIVKLVKGVIVRQRSGAISKPSASREIRWFALVRRANNPHDPNAIRVALFGEFFMGYIPKDIAAHLAPMMDAGKEFRRGVRLRQQTPAP